MTSNVERTSNNPDAVDLTFPKRDHNAGSSKTAAAADRTSCSTTGTWERNNCARALNIQNEVYCRYLFNTRLQEDGESAEDFVAALQSLARLCNFESQRDSLVRDRVVVGVRQDRTRERFFQESSLTLDQCLEICRQDETAAWMAEMAEREASTGADALRQQEGEGKTSSPQHPSSPNSCEETGPKEASPVQSRRVRRKTTSPKKLQETSVVPSRTRNLNWRKSETRARGRRKPEGNDVGSSREVIKSHSGEANAADTTSGTSAVGSQKAQRRKSFTSAAETSEFSNDEEDCDSDEGDAAAVCSERDVLLPSSERKQKPQLSADLEIEYTRGLGVSRSKKRRIVENCSEQVGSLTTKTGQEGDDTKSERKSFTCHVCGKPFLSAGALANHKQVHFGRSVRGPQSCPFCEKVCKSKSVLVIHMRSHTGERPYICDICGMGFKRKDCLDGHRVTHTGQKMCECEYCGKSFLKPEYLNQHRTLHTGEKKYECEHCGKRFNRSGGLLIHMRYHTNERPYVCEECGKAYVKLSHLKVHNATVHVKEGTIPCSFCPKMFKTKQQVKRHELSHMGEKKFMCDVCGAGFVRCTYLMQHMRTHEKLPAEGGNGSGASRSEQKSLGKSVDGQNMPASFQGFSAATGIGPHSFFNVPPMDQPVPLLRHQHENMNFPWNMSIPGACSTVPPSVATASSISSLVPSMERATAVQLGGKADGAMPEPGLVSRVSGGTSQTAVSARASLPVSHFSPLYSHGEVFRHAEGFVRPELSSSVVAPVHLPPPASQPKGDVQSGLAHELGIKQERPDSPAS